MRNQGEKDSGFLTSASSTKPAAPVSTAVDPEAPPSAVVCFSEVGCGSRVLLSKPEGTLAFRRGGSCTGKRSRPCHLLCVIYSVTLSSESVNLRYSVC